MFTTPFNNNRNFDPATAGFELVPPAPTIMTRTRHRAAGRSRSTGITRDLTDLVAALDRRVPQSERGGEAAIARDAADLRAEAIRRIADAERQDAPAPFYIAIRDWFRAAWGRTLTQDRASSD